MTNMGKPIPLDEISEKDLYWLAGLLEGEGSFIGPRRGDMHVSPRLYFGSTDLDIVERVRVFLGGSIAKKNVRPNEKPFYTMCLASPRSAQLMKMLKPLMGARRQGQIDKALAAIPQYRANPCAQCDGLIPRGHTGKRKYCSDLCGKVAGRTRSRERMRKLRAHG